MRSPNSGEGPSADEHVSRRSYLAGVGTLAAVGAVGTGAVGASGAAATGADATSGDSSQLFVIRSVADGPQFAYEFTVAGGVAPVRDGGANAADVNDSVTRNDDGTVTVSGTCGDGYGDSFRVTGEFTAVSVDASETAYSLELDGATVTEADLVSEDGGDATGTVAVADGSLSTGDSRMVPVRLTAAADGLAGFKLTVSTGDASVARIADAVGLPGEDGSSSGLQRVSVTDDGAAVSIEAVDIADVISEGDTGTTLATVTVAGASQGETSLSVTLERVEDETGATLAPATRDGTVSVFDGLAPVGDAASPPTDPDGDGTFEDVDGDGDADIDDVIALNRNTDDQTVRNNPDAFDFDGDGSFGPSDVIALLKRL